MRRDRAWIAAIACAGLLRVLLLAAAFPYFHPIDEHQHVETIHRWSRGTLPGPETSRLGDPVVDWALRFGTFEYLDPNPPPPYFARPGYRPGVAWEGTARRAFEAVVNQEAESPPGYYAPAALWYRVGELVLSDQALLFWVRALNGFALLALVLLSHAWLRRRHPDDPLLYRGVPALMAFLPQDAFYGIGPDGACALLGGLAFMAAVGAAEADGTRDGAGRDVRAGLLAAVAFLAKYTNLLYFGLLGLAYAARSHAHGAAAAARRAAAALGVAALAAGAWIARNLAVLGDPFGTARKVEHLEWQARPWGELFSHPIFTPAGFATWWTETLVHFWRGEFRWLGEPMTWPALDTALWAVSSAALAAGTVSAWRAARRRDRLEPFAALAVAGGFATLAVLSTRFTFADWGNPTRMHPYFTEGRLILGVLLPFAVVFVRGVGTLSERVPNGDRLAACALGSWLALVTAADFVLAAPAFASPWNLFP